MTQLHLTLAIAMFALNLLAGAWGVAAWLLRRPTTIFWYLLRTAQVSVVAQAVVGVLLMMFGHKAGDDLHYLYGILPLGLALVTEIMRVGAAQQVVGDTDYEKLPEDQARSLALNIFIAETRVMALGCLIIAALAVRAGITSGGI